MAVTRRELIIGALSAGAGALATSIMGKSPTANNEVGQFELLLQGRAGNRHPSCPDIFDNHNSVFTKISLQNGKVQQKLIKMKNAHYVVPVNNHIWAAGWNTNKLAVTDHQFNLHKFIHSDPGYNFTGHVAHLPNNFVVAPQKVIDAKSGRRDFVSVYDTASLQEVKKIPTEQLGSNDVKIDYKTGLFALTHSGNEYQAHDDYGKHYQPSLSVFDTEKLELIKNVPFAQNGCELVHLDSDQKGSFYTVFRSRHTVQPGAEQGKRVYRQLQGERFQNQPIVFHEYEFQQLKNKPYQVEFPNPVVRYDFKTDKLEEFMVDIHQQRRSQSVAHHQQSGKTYLTFMFSNTLMVFGPDGKQSFIDTRQLKVRSPIGVCDIPGTPYVAVMGVQYGVSVFHHETLEVIHHFDDDLYLTSHIYAYIPTAEQRLS